MQKRKFPKVNVPKEINLRQFWHIDVIIQYDPKIQRLYIKKPSGQNIVALYQRDILEKNA